MQFLLRLYSLGLLQTVLVHAMVEDCKVEIGGSKIDEHYGDWLNVWYELTHKVGQERGYNKMIGNVSSLTDVNTRC
jgi:hypothetical protein